MTDTKLLLTTLADKFEAYAIEIDSEPFTDQWEQGKVCAYEHVVQELREALALEELQHDDIGKPVADWETNADKYRQPIDHVHDAVPYLMGMSEREFKRHIADMPVATSDEIVGNDPADAASSKEFAADLKAMGQVTK